MQDAFEMSFDPINLGELDFWGMAVYDVDEVTDQLTQATGSNFAAATTTTYTNVDLPNQSPTSQNVTLESRWSLANGPFIQVVHANKNFRPWRANRTASSQFAGYAVEDIDALHAQFTHGRFRRIAYKADTFAFYRGVNGAMIQLLNEELLPTPQSNGSPPEGVFYIGDLFAHFDYSPCEKVNRMDRRISRATGIPFNDLPPFGNAEFRFYDSSNQFTHTQSYSIVLRPQNLTGPRIDLDQGLPVSGAAAEPFRCGDIHVGHNLPSMTLPGPPPGNTHQLDTQMIAAGLNRFCDQFLDIGQGPFRVLGFYRGKGGIVLETTDGAFGI